MVAIAACAVASTFATAGSAESAETDDRAAVTAATVTIDATFVTANQQNIPAASQLEVNTLDYAVRDLRPDFVGEQERWVNSQLPGFRKIFSVDAGYANHSPDSSGFGQDGTIVAHAWHPWYTLATFRWTLHEVVPNPVAGQPAVSGRRSATGAVVRHRATGKTLTYASVHLTPRAWTGDTFQAATDAWRLGIQRMKSFATNQINGGRNWVVFLADANANRTVLVRELGTSIAGKPVNIYTSSTSGGIDHIIVIGQVSQKLGSGVITGTHSDHDPFWAKLRLVG